MLKLKGEREREAEPREDSREGDAGELVRAGAGAGAESPGNRPVFDAQWVEFDGGKCMQQRSGDMLAVLR